MSSPDPVADFARDAYVAIDKGGRIVEWNAAAERLFGRSKSDVVGEPLIETLIPRRYRAAHAEGVAEYERTGKGRALGRRLEVFGLHGDGHEVPIELTVSPLGEGNRAFHAFIRDRRPLELGRSVTEALRDALVPTQKLRIPGWEVSVGYRPAAEEALVGGDFYDCFESASGSVAVVGDVMGKRVEAAALAALARHTIRGAARMDDQPAAVIDALTWAIREERTDEDVFCTVAYLRVGADGSVDVACAGHPPPLVVRAGGSVERACLGGSLVGPFVESELAEESVKLDPGEGIVLYTDGVTDAPSNGGFLGESGLEELVRSAWEEEPSATVERVEDVMAGGTPRDDATVLVARVGHSESPVPGAGTTRFASARGRE